ncbi:MAG TPA: GNAT family N-acetyltransferase [Polyangiaceae bacterium]|nr:GNAT family N-acetyltransferase [Polyangiaceae bacterium]
MSDLALRCVRLDESSAAAAAALFERESNPCYCRYQHFDGDKNAWLARLFHEPHENEREFLAMASDTRLSGVVALAEDGSALGWMKIMEHHALRKLYDHRLYRGLPCFGGPREGVFTVGCFFVGERFRRRGVARALLREGLAQVRAEGGSAVEAFPRGAESVPDSELLTGPVALFLREGFEVVNDFHPYPVLRLKL